MSFSNHRVSIELLLVLNSGISTNPPAAHRILVKIQNQNYCVIVGYSIFNIPFRQTPKNTKVSQETHQMEHCVGYHWARAAFDLDISVVARH